MGHFIFSFFKISFPYSIFNNNNYYSTCAFWIWDDLTNLALCASLSIPTISYPIHTCRKIVKGDLFTTNFSWVKTTIQMLRIWISISIRVVWNWNTTLPSEMQSALTQVLFMSLQMSIMEVRLHWSVFNSL